MYVGESARRVASEQIRYVPDTVVWKLHCSATAPRGVLKLYPTIYLGVSRLVVAVGPLGTEPAPPFLNHNFYFPDQLVGGFTLSDRLDKPWAQVSSLFPRYVPSFLSRIGFSPLLVDFHRMLLTHALAPSANQFVRKKKSLRVCALVEN